MASQVNQRRHPRVRPRELDVHLRTGDRSSMRCTVENLSAGGMLLKSERPLPAGTDVTLYLLPAGARAALKLTGTVLEERVADPMAVARARVPHIRVQFDPMADAAFSQLKALLKSLGATDGTLAPAALGHLSRRTLSVEIQIDEVTAEPEPYKPPAIAPLAIPPGPKTAAAAKNTATGASPSRPAGTPRITAAQAAPIHPLQAENQRLRFQIQGLLMELGEAQVAVGQKTEQIRKLREELAKAQAPSARR